MLTIRQAQLDDVDAMAAVEVASWPAPLAASRDGIATRVETFPLGQLVATLDGVIVGTAYAQRITSRHLAQTPATYDVVTDSGTLAGSHDSLGDVYELVGVGVSRTGHGIGIGRVLIDRQIKLARSLPGIKRIVGFTRPVRFHRHPEVSIEDYVLLRSGGGRLIDPVLSFHLDSGARLVSIHPDFRPLDTESGGYGVLIEYPVDPTVGFSDVTVANN